VNVDRMGVVDVIFEPVVYVVCVSRVWSVSVVRHLCSRIV